MCIADELLSVIIPAYNAGIYLSKCLESILTQTYRNLEIILINDGSTDETPKICDEYKERDKRIRVIHQVNIGLLASREKGVSLAQGERIAFVDSDDWIEPNYFEVLLKEMRGADIVSAGTIKKFVDEAGREAEEKNLLSAGVYETDAQREALYNKMLCANPPFEFGVLPYMWNKIFKKKMLCPLLKEVDKRIFDGEDVSIVYAYFLQAKKIVLSNYCGYHYVIHNKSMSNKKRRVDYFNEACLYEWLYKQFAASPYEDFLIPQLNRYMLMMLWKREPSMYIEANKFVFPYQRIPYGSKIIIYGAGDLGNAYLVQLQQNGYCDIIAVADQKYKNSTNPIEIVPDAIIGLQFDYIVVSVVNKMVADSIRNYLMNLGVEESKIVVGESMR